MASVQSELRARALALILGQAGQVGYTIAAGRFREVGPDDELSAAERGVELRMPTRTPMDGYNSPTCAQGLYVTTLEVVVTYVVGRGETDYEAVGEQSGGALEAAVEDRAADDAQVILATLGWQSNWATVTPEVIDPYAVVPAPPPPPSMVWEGSRATQTITLQILHRAAQYTAFGPSVA